MENFEHLRRADTMLLTTRRRDGRMVDTPVNLAVDAQGRGYFRTWHTAGKTKRLANFPGVRVAPCTRRGRPTGSDQPGIATRLQGADEALASALLADRFPIVMGRLVPLFNRVKRVDPVFFRIVPADEPTPWDG